jgi:hypothetical protein
MFNQNYTKHSLDIIMGMGMHPPKKIIKKKIKKKTLVDCLLCEVKLEGGGRSQNKGPTTRWYLRAAPHFGNVPPHPWVLFIHSKA